MRRPTLLIRVLVLMLGLGLAGTALAAQSPAVQTLAAQNPGASETERWARSLDGVEAEIQNAATTPDEAEAARGELLRVRDAAMAFRDRAQEAVAETEKLLAPLGPPPAEGSPPEDAAVAAQRKKLGEDLALYKGQVQVADLTLARADGLSDRISRQWRFWVWGALTKVFPSPWSPKVLALAVEEARVGLRALAQWVFNPPEAGIVDGLDPEDLLFAAFLYLFVLASGGVWLMARFGRRRSHAQPSYQRRLAAAIAHVNALGLFPAAFFAGIGLWVSLRGINGLTTEQAQIIGNALQYGALGWLAVTLPGALYAPDAPQWRLIPIVTARARIITRGIGILGIMAAAQIFVVRTTLLFASPSDYFASSYSAVVYTLQALLTAFLVHARSSEAHSPEAQDLALEDAARRLRPRYAGLFRALVSINLGIGVLALWIGYTNLGAYLVSSTILTGLGAGMLVALRNLTTESLGLVVERGLIGGRRLNEDRRGALGFWLRLLIDALFMVIAVIAAALVWGIPETELIAVAEKALAGFRVGSVRVSLPDVALGIGVSVAIAVLTSRLKRLLANDILPRTRFESGLRQSIVAGVGYLGTLIALMAGITVVGIDLSNIAIVAGALSVGIGFGLQNIVNNFVSGLILLFERPVKVGDWVVVGSNEGLIKHINVRSTEIQTFDLASVILPNAELISTAVTNWTHKDRRGRVEVKLSVAPDSDAEAVRDLLLDLAASHPRVVDDPAAFVIFAAIQPGSLDFTLRCYTDEVTLRGQIASELRFDLMRRLRARGIALPAPALGASIGPTIKPPP